MTTETQAPDPAPRPFTAVKAFADSVLAMLDERIKAVDQAAHPFNDYFGDQPETIVAAKAQAGELREVRTQVRILGDRALVELMKFKPAIPAPEGAQADERAAFEAELRRQCFQRPTTEAYDLAWSMWQARAALAAPAPQAPVALTDYQIVRIHEQPELAGARHESFTAKTIAIARAAIAEFCRVNGIPAPQTKEPKA